MQLLHGLIFAVGIVSELPPAALTEAKTLLPVVEVNGTVLGLEDGSLVLHKGDNLNMTCYSILPAQWTVKSGYNKTGPIFSDTALSKITIVKEQDVNGYEHATYLYLDDIEYFYTRLYSCMIEELPSVKKSIYMYASDPDNVFVDYNPMPPGFPSFQKLYWGLPAIVACRTSNPAFKVEFMRYTGPMHPKPLGEEDGVAFDPEVGVIIQNTDDKFDGMFECQVDLNGTIHSRIFANHIILKSEFPPTPSIVPQGDIYRLIGESFNMTCEVKVSSSLVAMNWFYHTDEQQNSERVIITNPASTKDGTMVVYRSILRIKSVTMNDGGIYRCEVVQSKKRGVEERAVYIREKTFVYLTCKKRVITVTEGVENSADFYIDMFAYPLPEYYWMKGNNIIIKHNTNIDHNITNNGGKLFLRLNYPKREDAGIYKVIAWNRDMTADITVELIVELAVKTFVYLTCKNRVITVTEGVANSADFYIDVSAYPLPEYYWMKGNKKITKHNTNIDHNIINNGGELFLRLKYPKREDAGIYKVIAWNRDMTADITVELIVEYAPVVNITTENKNHYFLMYIKHTIQCHVQSVPYPTTIDWFWQSCSSPSNCSKSEDGWEPVVQTDFSPVTYPKLVKSMSDDNKVNVSSLIVKENRVGWFRCTGVNSKGNFSDDMQYVASEWLNGRAGGIPRFYLLISLLYDEAQVAVRNLEELVKKMILRRFQKT